MKPSSRVLAEKKLKEFKVCDNRACITWRILSNAPRECSLFFMKMDSMLTINEPWSKGRVNDETTSSRRCL